MTIAVSRSEVVMPGVGSSSYNLLLTIEELTALFDRAVQGGNRLNAFLAAAAMSQIADEAAHPDVGRLVETAEYLEANGRSTFAWLPFALARRAQGLRERTPGDRALRSYRAALREVVTRTAEALVTEVAVDAQLPTPPPALRDDVLRPPACFHAFDQQPADVERLADEFARRLDGRSPLLVVGVRTSGSYLAPLFAAFVRGKSEADVRVVTARPGHPLDAEEREAVRRCAAAGGSAVVIDDPPGTGRSVVAVARALEQLDLARGSIAVAVPLFPGQDPPEAFAAYTAILLPGEEWEIERRFTPAAVAADLGGLLDVEDVARLALPDRSGTRGHRRELFRVRTADGGEATVLAEGVGLGFFGEQVLAVYDRLAKHLPSVLGLRDGVLYREWLADDERPADTALAPAVAAYVAARREALPVSRDPSARLAGTSPAWEVVSGILSRVFLRAWPVARAAFLDRATQSLLRPARASVVDGHTSRAQWLADPRRAHGVAKVGFADRSFWHLGLTSFDAVFDLAGLDPGAPDEHLAREARGAYEQLTGEPVDEERWLLYQLAQLWGRRRTDPEGEPDLRRASARALQRYFAAVILSDTAPPADGPLCAVDLDGVLETEALGVPATTTAGALALRALARHGFRAVLVTGRSASEVAERCAAYELVGGVAEYGSVAYDARVGKTHLLLPDDAEHVAGAVRETLAKLAGVELDGDYGHCLRAFRWVDGQRLGLAREAIEQVLRVRGVRAIRGESQTDFVIGDVDKGTGLRMLLDLLDETRLALAVGDTASDLPMFALAERAAAPASADAVVRDSGVTIVGRSYQAGFGEAVSLLLGHAVGGCEICAAPTFPSRTRLLLDILSAQEGGAAGVVPNLFRLAWRTRVG